MLIYTTKWWFVAHPNHNFFFLILFNEKSILRFWWLMFNFNETFVAMQSILLLTESHTIFMFSIACIWVKDKTPSIHLTLSIYKFFKTIFSRAHFVWCFLCHFSFVWIVLVDEFIICAVAFCISFYLPIKLSSTWQMDIVSRATNKDKKK